MSHRALIVIDLQNDYFPDGRWPLHEIDAAADNAARLIAAARERGDLVVHIRHEFLTPDAPFFAPGSEGAKIHPKVRPNAGEPEILKHRPNAFFETDLKSVLDEHGIRDITICGAMSHMCIDAATRAARDLGYAVTLVHDACATRDLLFNELIIPAEHVHAAFMAALNSSYATIVSTTNYLGQMRTSAR